MPLSARSVRRWKWIASASAVWYGIVSYLGFTLGGNWQRVMQLVTEYGRAMAITAAALILIGIIAWLIRSRKIRES